MASHHHTMCFPDNNLSFPTNARVASGLTEREFNDVLDEFEGVMWDEVNNQEGGAKLTVKRRWNDGAVNAYAAQYGIYREVTFFGGLARHPLMTTDAMRLVACHELGHHLAGRPYWPQRDPSNPYIFIEGTEDWAASEGESDYYASLKCFRHLVIEGQKNNFPILSSDLTKYPKSEFNEARKKCDASFTDSQDQEVCLRASLAGLTLGNLFKQFYDLDTSFSTPDRSIVSKTNYRHPKGQCRTDTYFQGALCGISYRDSLLKEDPDFKTCSTNNKHTVGVRPLCWYKPS